MFEHMFGPILFMGLTLQIIMFMLKNEFELESGAVWSPTLITIAILFVFPSISLLVNSTQQWDISHLLLFVLCIFQLLLFVIKITTAQDLSWWVVFFPLLIVFGIVLFPFLIMFGMRNKKEGWF